MYRDSPHQVRVNIVTKGELQDLLERTLCNYVSMFECHLGFLHIQNSAYGGPTPLVIGKDHGQMLIKSAQHSFGVMSYTSKSGIQIIQYS